MTDPAVLAPDQPHFSTLLGLKMVSALPDRVEASLTVRAELLNRNGVMHGGALMALADHVGGTGAFLNLAQGQGTTTLESKTNFFRAVPAGSTIRAVSIPLHLGRKTQVWQTTILREDGKVAALVTQTQMVLTDGPPA